MSTSPDSVGGSQSVALYTQNNPNEEPVVDRRFPSRTVRRGELTPALNREWEIAELEVYGDGSAPVGTYVSKVQINPESHTMFGHVRTEQGAITQLPVVVRTRSGTEKKRSE